MVGEKQTSAVAPKEVPYRPAIGDRPYEILSLSSLITRVGPAEFLGYQQLHFDLVIVCTEGTAQHEVDFEVVDLDDRHLLHLRPGQVHRWMVAEPYEATLILLRPLVARSHWASGPRIIALSDDQAHDLAAILTIAKHRPRSELFSPTVGEAIRQLVVAGLGFGQRRGRPRRRRRRSAGDRVASGAVERPVPESVGLLLRNELGCSTKTLTRSCMRATEMGPKQLIDTEVTMAAQRLLCLPGATVSSVAHRLAFDEITNFTKSSNA